MKRLLVVLGSIFLVLVVIIAIGIGYVAFRSRALDRESKAYADAAIPAIVDGWNEDHLKERMSSELRRVTRDADLDKLFQLFRKLGKFKKYAGSQDQAFMLVATQQGNQTTASYQVSADFESGHATIDLGLIKHGDQWQILGFRVDSRAFLDIQAK
jgi:hypothetical protein